MTVDPATPTATDYVKCRVCKAAMKRQHADAHLATHSEAGDLIRAAHAAEVAELNVSSNRYPRESR